MTDLPERALSIRQPWVWAILNAGKNIENRPRRFHYRGPICLHVSLYKNKAYFEASSADMRKLSADTNCIICESPGLHQLQFGGIIGTADIVDCVEHSDSPWFFGPFGLVLENIKPVEFVPVRGALGLFNWRKNL